MKGYEGWQVIAPSQTEDGLKAILGNPAMIQTYKDGFPDNGRAVPDGAMMAKIDGRKANPASLDGYELIRRVRASGSRIASIAVTAFARSDDRQTALESGFSTYLAKPIDARQLARTVRDLVHVETMA